MSKDTSVIIAEKLVEACVTVGILWSFIGKHDLMLVLKLEHPKLYDDLNNQLNKGR